MYCLLGARHLEAHCRRQAGERVGAPAAAAAAAIVHGGRHATRTGEIGLLLLLPPKHAASLADQLLVVPFGEGQVDFKHLDLLVRHFEAGVEVGQGPLGVLGSKRLALIYL